MKGTLAEPARLRYLNSSSSRCCRAMGLAWIIELAMQIDFTQHALTRMAERGISRAEVLATLAQPLNTIEVDNGRTEGRGWINRVQP